jgi:hypothetical protein
MAGHPEAAGYGYKTWLSVPCNSPVIILADNTVDADTNLACAFDVGKVQHQYGVYQLRVFRQAYIEADECPEFAPFSALPTDDKAFSS